MHNAIFVAPTLYAYDFYADKTVVEIGRVEKYDGKIMLFLLTDDSAPGGTANLQYGLFCAF
ncbi:hypothetical protein ACLB1R_31730 [Escherichia coli]